MKMSAVLHVEIVQEQQSCATQEIIIGMVKNYLENLTDIVPNLTKYKLDFEQPLRDHVKAVSFCDTDEDTINFNLRNTNVIYHVYRLNSFNCVTDNMADDDTCEELPAASYWQLPCEGFFNLWENLIYDTNVKRDVLNFLETALVFSDKGIDPNIITWNKIILLHGPPGTGKTSLCKALAQKLAIRSSGRYSNTQLVEINSHSVFSKWFSESGKLVMKLFKKIREIIDNPNVLVCVLIDEIESLAHARKAAFSGSEPSDSIRVVNAVLTQLDQIRSFPNVVILTTSNMTGAIDLAFVDRAGFKQYIGLPSCHAIYQIYMSCMKELMRKRILVAIESLLPYETLELCKFELNSATKLSLELLDLSKYSVGISGRSLRNIPFLTYSKLINKADVDLNSFLKAMKNIIHKSLCDNEMFINGVKDLKLE